MWGGAFGTIMRQRRPQAPYDVVQQGAGGWAEVGCSWCRMGHHELDGTWRHNGAWSLETHTQLTLTYTHNLEYTHTIWRHTIDIDTHTQFGETQLTLTHTQFGYTQLTLTHIIWRHTHNGGTMELGDTHTSSAAQQGEQGALEGRGLQEFLKVGECQQTKMQGRHGLKRPQYRRSQARLLYAPVRCLAYVDRVCTA